MTITSVTGTNPYSAILANSAVSTSSAASAASAGTAASAASSQNLANTFLTLLVAQMNNQDPLNPVDNAQLTQQMAQISTVTGINNLNTSVTNLMAELQQSASIQSAQLTGHSVMVGGTGLTLAANSAPGSTSGVSAVGGINLASAAQNVTVTVTDSSGATVRTIPLGAQGPGFRDFTWDGTTESGTTAPAGSYQFSVNATASNGSAVTATPYNLLTIVGAVPQADGSTQLMLNDGSQVAYSAVKQII